MRAYVFFRGRSIVFKDQGKLLLLRFANDLDEYARVDQLPKLEGKRMSMLFSPKKGVAKKKGDDRSNNNNHTSDEALTQSRMRRRNNDHGGTAAITNFIH